MKWEKIVEIQYDAVQRLSLLYIGILSAIAAFSEKLSLNRVSLTSAMVAFMLVLVQAFTVLYLTNVQREASWEGGSKYELNKRENRVRLTVLVVSGLATLSLMLTIGTIFISQIAKI